MGMCLEKSREIAISCDKLLVLPAAVKKNTSLGGRERYSIHISINSQMMKLVS
jgi:hypothetical protein